MSVITRVAEPNLWDVICKDFASRRPPYRDDDDVSVHTEYEDFDPAKTTPVFYGKMYQKMDIDADLYKEVDVSVGHTACVGYAFTEKPPQTPPSSPPPPPDKDKCSPREYLEHYVFPILLPGMEEMLKQAKKEKCFERKRTKFNALDFLTEYLWGRNLNFTDREGVVLWDIPFVKEWLKDHPRQPLPLSLLWTEEEAALVIQSHWRAYQVRKDPEVQELRTWQREWREENGNISHRVSDFWAKQMPGEVDPSPNPTLEANEEVVDKTDEEITVQESPVQAQ